MSQDESKLAFRLEAITIRLEAIATGLEAIAFDGSKVTTTTTSPFPWHYGLAMLGTGACPNGMGVSAVPLKQCEEAALKVVLPPGAFRQRSSPGEL